MTTIELELLAGVAGGAGTNSSTLRVGPFSATRTQSDYRYCVDTIKEATAQQYPSTKPWWNPFATDRNASPRAKATIDNIGATCGPPPP